MPHRANATTSFQNWDFQNFHVQQELFGGEFISAETTLVAAGPPRLSDVSAAGGANTAVVFPIGVLENVGISQSKQLQRVFEIGSRRSYFIPGRVVGSVTLGRILYHGPSLLKVLYAYYKQSVVPRFMYNPLDSHISVDGQLLPDPNAQLLDLGTLQNELHRVRFNPGYNDAWLSLFSDIFNQPFGLAFYFKNALERTYGAIYLDECYLQGHQVSISSGSVLIMEGVSAQFDVARPIQLSTGVSIVGP
jgi:hypothetical protein